MDEDTRFLQGIQNGDHGAFGQLVAKYTPTVFSTIYSVMGSTQEAEDIAQEVFLKVYASAGSFKGDSAFTTWLYRITVNRCMDEIRSRKRKFVSYETELGDDDRARLKDVLEFPGDNLEERFGNKEVGAVVQKLLGALPEKYRMFLVLKEVQGLSYDEIGKVMRMSPGSVRVALCRVRQLLKDRIEGYESKQGGLVNAVQ